MANTPFHPPAQVEETPLAGSQSFQTRMKEDGKEEFPSRVNSAKKKFFSPYRPQVFRQEGNYFLCGPEREQKGQGFTKGAMIGTL